MLAKEPVPHGLHATEPGDAAKLPAPQGRQLGLPVDGW
jgi:hypothetical protein